MKTSYILGLFLFLSSAFAQGETQTASSIRSNEVRYDGNALLLSGNVNLEHALGTLQSSFARLDEKEKEGLFSHILLNQDVLITLKNHGSISCDTAELNFHTLKGALTPKQGEKVRFNALDAHSLSLEGALASIDLIKDTEGFKISKIEATRGITASYLGDFFFQADEATYTENQFPHLIARSNCVLSHLGDRVYSESLEIFPTSSQILFSKTEGSLQSFPLSPFYVVDFSCDKLNWHKETEQLLLEGNAILQSGLGGWQCDQEIQVTRKQTAGHWRINSISSRGTTKLSYQQPDSALKHLLICHKAARLDQEKMAITLESPQDRPLEYYHGTMFLTAEQGQLDYGFDSSSLHPTKLLLTGNVRLSNLKEESGKRYAAADRFTYFPEEKKMILSSSQEVPVLFWDALQDLSISAKEIHIFRTSTGDRIQGIGNVRLTFSSTEHALLRKLFPFYKKEGALDGS